MDDIEARLLVLHQEYAGAVNTAIDEGRDELVPVLADEFSDAALALMTREQPAA